MTSIYLLSHLLEQEWWGGLYALLEIITTSSLDLGPWLELCLRIRTVTMLIRR